MPAAPEFRRFGSRTLHAGVSELRPGETMIQTGVRKRAGLPHSAAGAAKTLLRHYESDLALLGLWGKRLGCILWLQWLTAPVHAETHFGLVQQALAAKYDAHFTTPFEGAVYPPNLAPPLFQWESLVIPMNPGSWTLTVYAGEQVLHEESLGETLVPHDHALGRWRPPKNLWKSWRGKHLRIEARSTDLGSREHRTIPLSISLDPNPLPDNVVVRYFEPTQPQVSLQNLKVNLLWFDPETNERKVLITADNRKGTCVGCHSAEPRRNSLIFLYRKFTEGVAQNWLLQMEPDKDASGWTVRSYANLGHVNYSQSSSSSDRIAFSKTPSSAITVQYFPNSQSGGVFDFSQAFTFRYVNPSIDILLLDPATGSTTPLPGASSPDFVEISPSWSPDDKQIAFVRNRNLEKFPRSTG